MVTLYQILGIDPKLSDKEKEAAALNVFARKWNEKDEKGDATQESVAAHVLWNPSTRKAYQKLILESAKVDASFSPSTRYPYVDVELDLKQDTAALENFVANAKTKIAQGGFTRTSYEYWRGLGYGTAIGAAVGAAMHPDITFNYFCNELLNIGCSPGEVEFFARAFSSTIYSAVGSLIGQAVGPIYGAVKSRRDANQLSLPSDEYNRVQNRQNNNMRRIRRIALGVGLSALVLLAGQNISRTFSKGTTTPSSPKQSSSVGANTSNNYEGRNQLLPLEVKLNGDLYPTNGNQPKRQISYHGIRS